MDHTDTAVVTAKGVIKAPQRCQNAAPKQSPPTDSCALGHTWHPTEALPTSRAASSDIVIWVEHRKPRDKSGPNIIHLANWKWTKSALAPLHPLPGQAVVLVASASCELRARHDDYYNDHLELSNNHFCF